MQMKAPALSRPLDWSFPSNRFVVVVTPVAGTIAGIVSLLRGDSIWDAIGWGVATGGTSFLAWAIGRELHPDRAESAVVAALVAPVALVWGRPDLLATATVLLVARAVAGTTGRSFRWGDILLLAAVGGPIVVRLAGPPTLAVGAIGLVLTTVWHTRRRGLHVVAAASYFLGAVIAFVLTDLPGLPEGNVWILSWVGIGAGVVTLFGPAPVTTVEDRRGGGPVSDTRVRFSRLVALSSAAAVSFTSDPASLAPVWAALVATALRPR